MYDYHTAGLDYMNARPLSVTA